MKPPTVVDLVWYYDLVLSGSSGAVKMTLDSAASAGLSPMQALGFALAGCMAMDVVHILKKGRHDLRGLNARLVAERASEEPRRFTSVAMALHHHWCWCPRNRLNAPSISPATRTVRSGSSLRQDIELKVTYAILNAEC